ncbi:IgGFc-binding protein isoform X1 [Nothobranchius furzeri]
MCFYIYRIMNVRTSRLIFLLLAALTSATPPGNSTGQRFVVVFPENIAYYYPTSSQNKVWVTALHNATQVTVASQTQTLNSGQTSSFNTDVELKKLDVPGSQMNPPYEAFSVSNDTVQVTSNKNIIVQAFSMRKLSIQTALVIPTDKLGTKYFIPPVPQILGTTDGPVTPNVTERGPFRVIIVNSQQQNTVTFKGQGETSVTLQSNQVAQIWVPNDTTKQVVVSQFPVAVLFSHPCAMKYGCTCGLLTAALPPARDRSVKFPVPMLLAQNASVLQSDNRSSSVVPLNLNSTLVESSGTVVLYRPGLLLTLIPETEFASCFLVPSMQSNNGFIIIVVNKNSTSGIHIGTSQLQNPMWQELDGTDYISTNLSVTSDTTVVWHESSTMAVYFVANQSNLWFGNPAAVISSTPDFRGCAVTAEVVEVQSSAYSWTESIGSCKNETLELISLSDGRFQSQICTKLRQDSPQDVWIGVRRSSMTGDWYWLNNNPFTNTNWADGEPGGVEEGQCAVMSLNNNCGWRDEDCCKAIRPVCYQGPELLKLS